jgi:phage terminase large subunit|nr:MAG TPA: terminase large subunit [Caudoviricetes sp.]
MLVEKSVNERFEDFIFDWDYETYLLVGGYGSSKSYHIALKLILKCLEEKRKVLVVRNVFDTIKESCYDLLCEICETLNILSETNSKLDAQSKVIAVKSPLELKFPNGSRIIFKGLDKPAKLKSINGVSIVWIEECSEIKYAAYKELLGRLRSPDVQSHFILSTNPVGKENWVYRHFFVRVDEQGKKRIRLDDKILYERRTVVKNGVYYHHSTIDDNVFLPKSYRKRLDELKEYDVDLYRVARLGRFGTNGMKVLPQFEVAKTHKEVINAVRQTKEKLRFIGMDFGFEESYNAVVKMAVDDVNKILYIYWEYYKNHMTDDETADELREYRLNERVITADSAEPKTIAYYKKQGFKIRKCKKYNGSRLQNTKKIKRFKKIICSPKCVNCIRELSGLTYKKNDNGEISYDEFNIDPHTFSAIWYGLDRYDVADLKEVKRNSLKGG